jgi:hypothetical protein
MDREGKEQQPVDGSIMPEKSNEDIQIQSTHASDDGSHHEPEVSETEYLTGIKMIFCLGSLTLVFFLMMLDMSIIVTVSQSLVRKREFVAY